MQPQGTELVLFYTFEPFHELKTRYFVRFEYYRKTFYCKAESFAFQEQEERCL